MIIDKAAHAAMLAHMFEERPREGVGLLAGPARPRCPRDTNGDGNCGQRICPDCGGDGRVCDTWLPLRNVAEFPRARYETDPVELLAAWERLETAGRRPWIVCHSHVSTSAVPSDLDIRYAVDRTLHHAVVSLAAYDPVTRVWALDPDSQDRDGRVRRVRVLVADLGFLSSEQRILTTDLTHDVTAD